MSDVSPLSSSPPLLPLRYAVWSMLLSLGVLVVIGLVTFEAQEFRAVFERVHPGLLAAAFGMLALRVLMGGWRIRHAAHGRMGLRAGIRTQLAWDFSSNITPAFMGGAPLAALYVAQDSQGSRRGAIPLGEATASLLFVMLLDQCWFALMAPVIFVAALFLEVIPRTFGTIGTGMTYLYFFGFMIWTGLLAYGMLFRPELLQRLADRMCRIRGLQRFRDRVAHEMAQFGEKARLLRAESPWFFLKGLLLTAGTWLPRYLLMLLIVWSVHPAVDQGLFLLRAIALNIAALVMPTPGGAGGVEGLYAVLFSPLMPHALVLPTLVIWRVMAYYLFLPFGVILSTHQVQKRLHRRRRKPSSRRSEPRQHP